MGSLTESTPLLTFEQFEAMPEQPGKQELLRGELVELPPPELNHARIAHRIYKAFDQALEVAHARGEARELGEALIEAGYYLDQRSYVQPDVAISHGAQSEGKYFNGAPAVAIEVISPSNRARHMDLKTELYFQFGALEVWQLYPSTRRVVVHTEGGSKIRLEHDAVSTPLLPGFSLSLSEILAD